MEVPVTPFLTREVLGGRLHVAPRTLHMWAQRGEGPEYRVVGGRVLYRLEDVEAWEKEQWEKRESPLERRRRKRADREASEAGVSTAEVRASRRRKSGHEGAQTRGRRTVRKASA